MKLVTLQVAPLKKSSKNIEKQALRPCICCDLALQRAPWLNKQRPCHSPGRSTTRQVSSLCLASFCKPFCRATRSSRSSSCRALNSAAVASTCSSQLGNDHESLSSGSWTRFSSSWRGVLLLLSAACHQPAHLAHSSGEASCSWMVGRSSWKWPSSLLPSCT